eukprot:44905-Eustigmatos_ZCMA.PRE.1
MKFLQNWIQRNTRTLSHAIVIERCACLGGVMGGAWGYRQAYYDKNGYAWRPMLGTGLGFVTGAAAA